MDTYTPREYPQAADPYALPPPPETPNVPPPTGVEGYTRGILGYVGRQKAAKRQAVIEDYLRRRQAWQDRMEYQGAREEQAERQRPQYLEETLVEEEGGKRRPNRYLINKRNPSERVKLGEAYVRPDTSISTIEALRGQHPDWPEERIAETVLDIENRSRNKFREPRQPTAIESLFRMSTSGDPRQREFAKQYMGSRDPALRARMLAAAKAATAAAMEVDPEDVTAQPVFNPDKFSQAFEAAVGQEDQGGGELGPRQAPEPPPSGAPKKYYAKNPKTGEVRVWNGKTWVPATAK